MILHQIITPNTTGGSHRAGSTWKNSKSFRGVQIHLGSKLTELELDIGFIPFQLEHLSGTIDPGSSCRPVGKGNHPRYRSFIELLKITAQWFSNKTTSPSEMNHQLEEKMGKSKRSTWTKRNVTQLRRVGSSFKCKENSHHITTLSHRGAQNNNRTPNCTFDDVCSWFTFTLVVMYFILLPSWFAP